MLAPDVVVPERHRLLRSELERAHRARRIARVVDGGGSLRRHRAHQLRAEVGGLDVERLQHLQAEVAALVDDADQQVDRVDVLVGDLRGDLVRELEHVLGPRSEAAVEPAVACRLHLLHGALECGLADRRDGQLGFLHRFGQCVGEVDVDLRHGVIVGLVRGYVKAVAKTSRGATLSAVAAPDSGDRGARAGSSRASRAHVRARPVRRVLWGRGRSRDGRRRPAASSRRS